MKEIHQLYLTNSKQIEKCSKFTKFSISAVEQAASYGKGTITTHVVIFCWGMNIPLKQLSNYIPKLRKISAGSEKIDYMEELLAKVLRNYKIDEIIAWLELLLQRYKIELKLGLRKKPGRPSKKKSP